jgi:hypothetical protein
MGVSISVYATSLSYVNFTAYTATCFGRTTIFRKERYILSTQCHYRRLIFTTFTATCCQLSSPKVVIYFST